MAFHGTAQSNRIHATREWNTILLGVSCRHHQAKYLLPVQSISHLQSATRTMDYDIQRNLEENGKPPQGGEPIRLSVEHMLGALLLLLFGNVFATISFSVEMLTKYFDKNKLKVHNIR